MKTENTSQLIQVAIRAASLGAQEYLRTHNQNADPGALAECICAWVKIKLPEAMHDSKEALECHLDKIAEMTFAATMAQAGIEAAKEAGLPA
jgi:hypothetical protein